MQRDGPQGPVSPGAARKVVQSVNDTELHHPAAARNRRDRIAQARSRRLEGEISRRGIMLNRAGPERHGSCPRCGGVDRFSINVTKQLWNCRGCQRGGDVIALVQHLDICDFLTAVATLAGHGPKVRMLGSGP
jgi:hypothetical protein